jgi:excisionase family DNA binding protein
MPEKKMSLPLQIPARGAMSIREFTRWACICRTKVYQEISAGRLRIHKVGRKTIISYADAEQWLAARAVDPAPAIVYIDTKKPLGQEH